jgi:hypothetical protein
MSIVMNGNPKQQIRILLFLVFTALLLGIYFSAPLWFGDRHFPKIPIPGFQFGDDVFDIVACVLFLAALFAALLRPGKKFFFYLFFGAAIFLMARDQNRLQPWVLQFLFFVAACFPNEKNKPEIMFRNICLIFGGVYFWSGIHKININYFTETSEWIMEPLGRLTGMSPEAAGKTGYLIPLIEIVLGFGFLFKRTLKLTAWVSLLMHGVILLLIGPLGKNFNPVIYPWNLGLMAMLYWVIRNIQEEKEAYSFKFWISRKHLAFLIPVWILPLFSIFGIYDNYPAWKLYSGNSPNGYVFLSEQVISRLPGEIQNLVQEKAGQKYIYINYWSLMELGVPSYPEPRVFKKTRAYLLKYADSPDEVPLLISDEFIFFQKQEDRIIR